MKSNRPSSASAWLLSAIFVGCLACWGWSYVGATYLDGGRLLVIDRQPTDVSSALYNLLEEVKTRKDAEDYLTRPKAWYALQKAAMSNSAGPTYTDLRAGFGYGFVKASDPLAPPNRLYAFRCWPFRP